MSKKLIWEKNGDIFEADGFQMYPVSLNFEILPGKNSFHLQLCSDKDCVGFDDYLTLEEAQDAAQRIIDQIYEQISQRGISVPLSEKTVTKQDDGSVKVLDKDLIDFSEGKNNWFPDVEFNGVDEVKNDN